MMGRTEGTAGRASYSFQPRARRLSWTAASCGSLSPSLARLPCGVTDSLIHDRHRQRANERDGCRCQKEQS